MCAQEVVAKIFKIKIKRMLEHSYF